MQTSNMIHLLMIAFYECVLSELTCYSTSWGNRLSARVIYIKGSSKKLFKNNTVMQPRYLFLKVILFYFKGNERRCQVAHFSLGALRNSLGDKQKLSVNHEAYVCLLDP